jgi:uncharacterized protein (DUF58 family)
VLLATEFAERPRRQKGSFDDDFRRLREYFPGDSPNSIHWRTSARRNELMVREYQQSRDQPLAVFLDLWQPAHPTRTDLDRIEYAVSFAATVCVEHLKTSRETRLHLWISGRDVIPWKALPGLSSIESVLDTLALVQAGPSAQLGEMFYEALPTLPSHVRIVMITTRTESPSQNRLKRRGQAHFAPKTPQNEPVPDGVGRVATRDGLQSLGLSQDVRSQIKVLVADPDQLSPFFVLPGA